MTEKDKLSAAYILLLSLPHDSVTRVHLQSAMASVRDAVALLHGEDAESVQNFFESIVQPGTDLDVLSRVITAVAGNA